MPFLLLGAGLFSALLGASSTLTASRAKAAEIRAKAQYDREVAQDNAEMARRQKAGAISAGDFQVGQIEFERRKIRGAQRAIAGASGLDASVGTGAVIGVETDKFARMDMITARNNAWRVAWGFEMEALQFEKAGIQATLAGSRQSESVLSAGRAKAFGQVAGGLLNFGASALRLPSSFGDSGSGGSFSPVTAAGGAFLGQRRGKNVGAASAGFGGFGRRF